MNYPVTTRPRVAPPADVPRIKKPIPEPTPQPVRRHIGIPRIQPSQYPEQPKIIVDTGKHGGLWESMPKGAKTFVSVAIVAAGTGLAAWLIYLLVRKQVRQVKADKVQNQSFGGDKHSTWAKQIQQAFENDSAFGWGTDEEVIRQTMRAIPSQEDFNKVVEKYRDMTKGGNLVHDMSEELSTSEYDEMLAIMNSKPKQAKDAKPGARIYDPKGWAKRFHSAVNYHYWMGIPGTDERAIKAVFQELPTRQAFYDTAYQYRKLYGVSLWTDLDGDLNWSMDWRAMLKKKPAH